MTRHLAPALGFASATTAVAVTARDLVHWLVALLIGLIVALLSRAIQYRCEQWRWYRRLTRLDSVAPPAVPSVIVTPSLIPGEGEEEEGR